MVLSLATLINEYIDKDMRKCEVDIAPFAVFLNSQDKKGVDYVEPDIVIICDKDKLDDKGCHGAPDWVMLFLLVERLWIIISSHSYIIWPECANIGS